MKKIRIFGLLLVTAGTLILMSFITEKNESLTLKDIEASVVKINDKLFAGKYEVSNSLYAEFLHNLKVKNQTELYSIALIDSLNWRDKLAYNEPLVEFYFRHQAYKNYPLVNVSYEGANLFCQWLTEEYNSNPKRKYKKVLFRLPTQLEWENAAKGGLNLCDYAWGNKLFENDHYMCNFRRYGDENIRYDSINKTMIVESGGDRMGMVGTLNDAADITAPVNSYWPNKFGLFNVCGNVAEMVSEKGISRGGGWKNAGGDVRIESKGHYSKSATDVGFRYFMEIIEI
ncbi:MAG: SUMF1/EgtB/PvdO family nonheme iron enzyme [Bacteroidetes bacterium]|nr:SUMF1/EgtB/PvdO family nonheme iron enzyme [Bacteroidota bacterium]